MVTGRDVRELISQIQIGQAEEEDIIEFLRRLVPPVPISVKLEKIDTSLYERLVESHKMAEGAYYKSLVDHPGKIGLHEELRSRLRDIDKAMIGLMVEKADV